MHPATLGAQNRRTEQSWEVTHTPGNAAQLPPSHPHRPSSRSWMRGDALTGGCCGKAKHGLGGLAFPAGAAERARAPSPWPRALAEREGALLPRAAHGADQSMHAKSEPHPSQHHVCMCPVRRTYGTQHPESHDGRAALLSGQPGPKTRQLPLLAAAGLATGPRTSGRDSLHPWVPTPLPAGSPSLPAHPVHPKPSCIPPGFPRLHPSGGLAGRGLPPAGGPAPRGSGWQASSTSSIGSVAMPPRAPMVSPGAGAASRAPGTAQTLPAPASSRGLLLLL